MEKIKLLLDKIKATPLDKKIGYILLAPPVFSVAQYIKSFILFNPWRFFDINYVDNGNWSNVFNSAWTGVITPNSAYTSALPFYLGLMAIAGAYLIKDKK